MQHYECRLPKKVFRLLVSVLFFWTWIVVWMVTWFCATISESCFSIHVDPAVMAASILDHPSHLVQSFAWEKSSCAYETWIISSFPISFKQITYESILISALLSERHMQLRRKVRNSLCSLPAGLDPFVLWTDASVTQIHRLSSFLQIRKWKSHTVPVPSSKAQKDKGILSTLKYLTFCFLLYVHQQACCKHILIRWLLK